MYGVLVPNFWDDESITALSIEGRLVAAFLITSRHSTAIPGLVNLGVAGLAEAARMPVPVVAKALDELVAAGFAEFDRAKNLIRIPNAPKYNRPRNRNMVLAWRTRWRQLPQSPLKATHLQSLKSVVCEPDWGSEAWELAFGDIERDSAPLNNSGTVAEQYPNNSRTIALQTVSSVSDLFPEGDCKGGRKGHSPAKGKVTALARFRAEALALWEEQNQLRLAVIPRARKLEPSDQDLGRVAERLAEGRTVDECRHVLRVYAAEARRNPKAARWFNGETNWRPDNFARALGSPDPGDLAVPGASGVMLDYERKSLEEAVARGYEPASALDRFKS